VLVLVFLSFKDNVSVGNYLMEFVLSFVVSTVPKIISFVIQSSTLQSTVTDGSLIDGLVAFSNKRSDKPLESLVLFNPAKKKELETPRLGLLEEFETVSYQAVI